MKYPYRTVYLSDRAYEKLVSLTIGYQYSNTKDIEDVTRIRGMHLLIATTFAKIPPEEWADNRPDYLKVYDRPHPFDPTITVKYWYEIYEEARRRRSIKITDSTYRAILDVSAFHSMLPPRPTTHINLETGARMSIVLEAWGLDHLKPAYVPKNPNPLVHYGHKIGSESASLRLF